MTQCWKLAPCQRPTFTDLRNRLDRILEDSSPADYLTVGPCLPRDVIVASSVEDDDVSVFGSGSKESHRKFRRSVSDCERYVLADSSRAKTTFQAKDRMRRSTLALLPLRVPHRSQDDILLTSASSARRLLSRSSLSTSDPGYDTQKSSVFLAACNSETQL